MVFHAISSSQTAPGPGTALGLGPCRPPLGGSFTVLDDRVVLRAVKKGHGDGEFFVISPYLMNIHES